MDLTNLVVEKSFYCFLNQLRIYHDNNFVEKASKRAVLLVHKQYDRNKLAEEYIRLLNDIK